MSNEGGRPRTIKTPEEFSEKTDAYIADCGINDEPITWTGLALSLGFSCRASIDEYLNYDGFSYSVKRAKSLVENAYEKRLSGNSPSGAIFALKNMNWKDKIENEHSGGLDMKVTEIALVAPGHDDED